MSGRTPNVLLKIETDSSGDALSKPARRTAILNVIILILARHLVMVASKRQSTSIYSCGRTYMTIGRQQREYSSEKRTTLSLLISRHVQKNVFFSMLFWQLLLFMLIHGIVRTIRIHHKCKAFILDIESIFRKCHFYLPCSHSAFYPWDSKVFLFESLNSILYVIFLSFRHLLSEKSPDVGCMINI